MGKSNFKINLKDLIIPVNLLIIIGYYFLTKDDYNTKEDTKEGVINTNCCGGIKGGVHYKETDRKPPDYVRRCFKSGRDNSEVVYQWSGFPCTSEDSSDCCTNMDGTDLGTCVPTKGGGYCESDMGNHIFRRGSSSASPYIKRSDDTILDINNTVDMEDYFYDRSSDEIAEKLSPDMLAFLRRRDKNDKYIQSHIIQQNKDRIKSITEQKLKAGDEKKFQQLRSTILAVHLIFVVTFAILIKDNIIADIQGFFTMLSQRYLEFAGKTIPVKTN